MMVKNLGIFMHAVSIAHLEMSAVTMKAMEETEEKPRETLQKVMLD